MNSEYITSMDYCVYVCILSYRNQTTSKYPSNPPLPSPPLPPSARCGGGKGYLLHAWVEGKGIKLLALQSKCYLLQMPYI